MLDHLTNAPFLSAATAALVLLLVYLVRLNQLLLGTPDEIKRLTPTSWTKDLLRETYRRLEADPITTSSYAKRIPPELGRRYIVTGGSGESTLLGTTTWHHTGRPTPAHPDIIPDPRSRSSPPPPLLTRYPRSRRGVHRAAAP